MADKSKILTAFNNHFFEFIDDIITIFPENTHIQSSKTMFTITKKINVTLLIKIWGTFIEQPYGELLQQGNIEYFINKDYTEDVNLLKNSQDVLKGIDGLRNPIKNMSEDNKAHSLEYLNNLCRLSKAYMAQ